MNNLRERLDRLADAAADGVDVTRPDTAVVASRRPWWRTRPALATAAALAVAAAGTTAVFVGGGGGDGDGDDDVAAGDEAQVPPVTHDALVSVTYGDASVGTESVDLTLRFLDADGRVIAERSWSEVEQAIDGSPGETVVMGGLVQGVPAGDLALEATLRPLSGDPVSCTQPFTAGAGDRLILGLQLGATAAGPGADPACAGIQPVEDWVAGRTGESGVAYIGLTEAEAETQAQSEGLTTRVVATDGMDLAVTMDLRPDRLDLMLFDGVVVAAQPGGEQAVADPPDLPPLSPAAGATTSPSGSTS
ncbi:MAG: hypothetical protein ACRDZN_07425 [Acidimicrobiales bacterium]